MINKLTDTKLRSYLANPPAPGKYADGAGLYLQATATGSLLWKFKYRVAGLERKLSIGAYPAVSLEMARIAREIARVQLASGVDPSEAKQAAAKEAKAPKGPQAEAPTFGKFARELLADYAPKQAPQTVKKWAGHMRYAIDAFGERDPGTITGPEVLDFLKMFQANGRLDTMQSVKRKMSDVFKIAMFRGACLGDPTAALGKMLLAPTVKAHAAIIDPAAFGAMLRTIDGYRGAPTLRGAMLFLALTFQRPGMVRAMEWREVDLEAKIWRVPAAKMKGQVQHKRDHWVPLSEPALEVLRAMLPFAGEHEGALVFPGRNGKSPMSDAAINKALRDLGIENHVGHGFRASANTILKEHLAERLAEELPTGLLALQELIDLQLAHVIGNEVQRAYNRANHFDERAILMRVWGEFIQGHRRAKGAKLELAA